MSGQDHLKRLHALPCVVCTNLDREQSSKTVAHHVEWARDENSDYAACALCDDCHKELHRLSRRGFAARYKLTEVDLLALTVKELETAGLLI